MLGMCVPKNIPLTSVFWIVLQISVDLRVSWGATFPTERLPELDRILSRLVSRLRSCTLRLGRSDDPCLVERRTWARTLEDVKAEVESILKGPGFGFNGATRLPSRPRRARSRCGGRDSLGARGRGVDSFPDCDGCLSVDRRVQRSTSSTTAWPGFWASPPGGTA